MTWLYLILGILVVVAPWILGFSSITGGLWGNVVLGLIIVIAALYEMSSKKS